MEGLVIAAIIIGLANLYRYYKQDQVEEDADEVKNVKSESSVPTQSTTRNLVLATLRKMGCEYHEEEGLRIRLTYQGETFMIDADNECSYIDVYDPWWFDLTIDGDIEVFARMQKAINSANCVGTCTVLYTTNEDEGLIVVHSKKNVIFVPEIMEIDKYLAHIFEDFFKIQRYVFAEMDKLKNLEILNQR